MSVCQKGPLECFSAMLISWWWVICFVFLCFVSYTHASKKKMETFDRLNQRCTLLMHKRDEILKLHKDLTEEIHSQSDPLWIELVLMKGLGLVPEGQKKILFQDEP